MTYNKTNWKTGDVITAKGLNNLESGVSNNDTSVTELNEAKAVFAQNILDLQTNKANQSEVDQIQGDVTALDGDVTTISNTVDTLQTGVQSNTENITNLQNALPNKQDKLTAGNNIIIDDNNVISATASGGSGDVTLAGNNNFTGNNIFAGTTKFTEDVEIHGSTSD